VERRVNGRRNEPWLEGLEDDMWSEERFERRMLVD
jgi:hypothetical protein